MNTIDRDHTFTLPGGDYTFAPITLNDWGMFCNFLNGQAKRPPDTAIPLNEMLAQADTLTGGAWLAHRSLQKHHAGTKIGQVKDIIGSLDMLLKIVDVITAPPEDTEGNPPEPKGATPT